MNLLKQNGKSDSQGETLNASVVTPIILFIMVALSIILYITTHLQFYEEVLLLRPIFSVSTVLGTLPIIFSVITYVLYIYTIDSIKRNKLANDATQDINNEELLEELRKPTTRRYQRRKRLLWTLFVLTIISLVATQSYFFIVMLFVVL